MTTAVKSKAPQAGEIVSIGDKFHQMHDTNFGLMAMPHTGDKAALETVCLHNLPLIPLALFYQVLNWQREQAKAHSCETHTSLFLIDGEWIAEPFHQDNVKGSLTIDLDYTHKDNEKRYNELKDVAEKGVHATIHNHVNAPAGQSSVDVDDELGLCGPHITLGNMEATTISWDARFSLLIGTKHHFIDMRVADIIALPLPPNASKEQVALAEKMVLTNVPLCDWPDEWDDLLTINTPRTAAVPATMGKPVAASVAAASASTGTASKVISFSDIGATAIDPKQLDLKKAPWGALKDIDCANWVTFRTEIYESDTKLDKFIMAIQMLHGCALSDIFNALATAQRNQ